jgi:hypothetical protein
VTDSRGVKQLSMHHERGEAVVAPAETATEWLLASSEPAIRHMAARDLLGGEGSAESPILEGPKVRQLLAGQRPDGGFGVHPYRKWTGAHWRLVSLVELALPSSEPRALAALETVLRWLTGRGHRANIRTIDGLTRRCASQEGNALAVAGRLGMQDDPRVQLLAESLIEWQWPDGGWNCDVRAGGHRSSFHESLSPMWGLHEFADARDDEPARTAARRTAELFLDHRLFRSGRTGRVIHPEWIKLHFPPYWHYDILRALVVLARMGLAMDPRASDALDLLEEKRMKDGTWRPDGYWWSSPGSSTSTVEVVDWGRGGSNEMITLHALTVLESAGRLDRTRR